MDTQTHENANLLSPAIQDFAKEVQQGLSASPKSINSRFIYDDEGSRLFEKIMKLEEYYPTDCEYEILSRQGRSFVNLIGNEPFNLVELGAGNGEKTAVLLNHYQQAGKRFTYFPIDISSLAVQMAEEKMQNDMPQVTTRGITAEYFEGLKWLKNNSNQPNIVLFMGGNIGNFSPEESHRFLNDLQESLKSDDILIIGCDLVKDYDTILRAYNDSQGITRDFQLNLLHRINRELGGHLDVDKFMYYPIFNPAKSAIESYLVSLEEQEVYVEALDQHFSFGAYEPVHTEYSFKFTTAKLEEMAASAGFSVTTHLFDNRNYFVNSIWQVR